METSQDASKILRDEILQQSQVEAESVLESAKKEANRILKEAEKKAQAFRDQQMKIAEEQAGQIEKKVLSSVFLEVKKQRLRMREALMTRMLESVEEKLNAFRDDKSYGQFLENLILEGILSLDGNEIDVVLSAKEKSELNEKSVVTQVKSASGRDVKVTVCVSKNDEGGALITSKDGRTRFDNRFSALIKRNIDTMRLTVMKEVIEKPSA